MSRLVLVSLVLLGCGQGRPGLVGGGDPPGDASPGGEPEMPPSGVAGQHGAAFRLWAPHAQSVSVVGDFNNWDAAATPLMAHLGAPGIFSAFIADAQAGQRYRFIVHGAGGDVERADPRGRAMDDVKGASILVDPTIYAWQSTSFTPPPPPQRIVYELLVGTFNPPGGKTPGRWTDAAAKLDYLAALGVTLIEVMPPAEFNGSQSWGYNTAVPFALEQSYGAPDDFRAFVDAAHARGMGVLVDVVHNHYDDVVLRCFDGDCMGADGVYFYTDGRRNTPWGPRADFGRAEVQRYILDDTRMWLDEYRADGFRWDSVSNIRQANGADNAEGIALLRQASDLVHQTPGAIQVAEDLQGYDAITRPTKDGGFGFDTQWDAAFFHPVDDAILAGTDAQRSMAAVRDAIVHGYGGQPFARVIYTESHDEVANGKQRIPQMVSPADPGSYAARKRSTLGAALVFTAPGTPMIFMGQELLESGYFADNHPLDWSKATRYAGIVQLYRDLIALRRNRADLTRGLAGAHVDVFHVNDASKVIAYRRWDQGGPGDDVVIAANFSGTRFPVYQIGLPSAGTWRVRFDSDARTYSPDYGDLGLDDVVAQPTPRDGQPCNGSVALAPYSVVILSQDR
jgi:1,4-alpha-glucan branching enzyme